MARKWIWVVAILMAGGMGTFPSNAGERMFTYVYESDTLPEGGLEFEQWVTYRNAKAQGNHTRWDMRDEIEYGITSDLQTSLYVNYTQIFQEGVEDFDENGSIDSADTNNEWQFKGVSSEWIHNILSPYDDPIGVAVYLEGTVSDSEGELEEKLLLSKNIGENWVLAFNAAVEQEWNLKHHGNDMEGKFEMDAGVAYKIIPQFSIGAEAKNQRVYPENLAFEEHSVWFVGPNLHYGNGQWWITATLLPQIAGHPDQGNGLNYDDNERIEARLIAGINF